MKRSSDFSLVILLLCSWCIALPNAVSADTQANDARRLTTSLERVQIPFVRNEGQYAAEVAYYARTLGGVFFVTRDGQMVISLPAEKDGEARSVVIREEAVAGSGASPRGLERSSTRVSHFIGNEPGAWQVGVATFRTISLGEIYEGIELRLKAYGNRVEKIFVVQPGFDPDRIKLRAGGIGGLSVDQDGALRLRTDYGPVIYSAPVAYQETERGTHHVQVAYAIDGDAYGFELGSYDKARPLVIDPILNATYLGGSADDPSWSLAFDASGNVYVAGRTFSTDFPGVDGSSAQTSKLGLQDVYVAKLNPGLNVLYHATYLGGTGSEEPGTGDGGGPSIGVHPITDDVYVTGWTSSSDFPATANGWQNNKDAGMDAYITILDNSLDTVVRSTYFGGGDDDLATALAFHPVSGDVCITGRTQSTDLPGVSGGDQESYGGGTWDGFAACFDQDLTPLSQATYIGGVGMDWPFSIAIDDDADGLNYGSIYVAGHTDSTSFPSAVENQLVGNGGGTDAFVTIADEDLTTTWWATFIGGGGEDRAFSVKVHPLTGDVYLGGTTTSSDFPGTDASVAQPDLGGATDAFISRLSSGVGTHYEATYFGGSDSENSGTLAISPISGRVYLAGHTMSTDLPGVAGGAQEVHAGDLDVYVASHDASLSTLHQATYYGGSSRDMGYAIGLDPASGEAYVTGLTWSRNLPGMTPTFSAQPEHGGGNQDGYVARLDASLRATAAPDIAVTPLSVDFGTAEVGTTTEAAILISNEGGGELSVTGLDLADTTHFNYDIDTAPDRATPACGTYSTESALFVLDEDGRCVISVLFQPASLGVHNADLIISSDDPDEDEVTVTLEGTGGSDPDILVTPSAHSFGVLVVGDSSSQSFKIANVGAAALSIEDIYESTGSRDFSWKASDCTGGFPFLLGKGESCEILINFAPTDYGERNASFAIDSNDPDEPTVVVDVIGGKDTQYLLVEPTEIDFGTLSTGNLRTASISVTNLGLNALEIKDVELRDLYRESIGTSSSIVPLDGDSNPFSVLFAPEAETTCRPPPFFLSKGETCVFAVQVLAEQVLSKVNWAHRWTGSVAMTSNDPEHIDLVVPVKMVTPVKEDTDFVSGGCHLSSTGNGPSGFLSIAIFSFVFVLLQRSRLIVGRQRRDPNGVGGKT